LVSGEVVAMTILSVVFSLIAAYIAIAFILPMIRALVKEIIEDNAAVGGFMSVLVIVVYILLIKKVLEILTAEALLVVGKEGKKSALSYLTALEPGVAILDQLLPHIGWVLLGSLVAFGLRHYFKK
jgi:hypothetical protein